CARFSKGYAMDYW
nr:immunoglobulin heavy chain junction region [Mus musculus]